MSAAAAASPAEKAPAAAPGPTASSANAAIENGLIQDGLFERCLEPLLRAAGWRGQTRQIVEAMPHLEQLQSVNELRLVLHRLGYRSTSDLVRADEILDERLPAVTLHDGAPRVLLARAASGELLVFDSETQETAWAAPPRGGVRLYRVYSPLDGDAASEAEADHEWLRNAFFSVGGDASVAGLLTLFANILALAAPLATMVVFNVILPSEGVLTLGFLAMIAIGALYLENRLRRKRSEILSSAAARVNCAILVKSFGRILALPAAMVEAASVTAQVTRMRQFESILGAFSGAVMGAVFDLPFIIVFLLAIFLLGGPLVLIPIVAVVLFALMGLLISPASHRANRKAAMSKERAQSLTFEMITNLDTIQSLDAATIWRRRLGEAQRNAVGARIRAAFLDHLRESGSLFIIGLSMIMTLCFGALMIVAGDLTVGALVAITMFGARALSPVQITFLALQQLGASREAAQRFDSLLKLKIDHNAEKAPAVFRPFKGAIRMRDIAYRFPNADDFAIRGVTAEIEPGQVIGIVGSNGSGKSTLLKMILGLYRPMSGQILLDSANMAQIHSPELRATIAFAGSKHEFFYGTIEQNMKLGCPTATIAQIEAVCEELDIDLDGPLFPKRLETRYSAQEFGAMSGPMRQKLCLARAFVKDAPVTLLDEPDAVLDASGAAAFARVIERRRGAKTIVMTLNDRRHLAICDKLLVLNAGKLVRFDDAKTILGEIAAQQAK